MITFICKYIKNNVLKTNFPPLSAGWRREGEKKGVSICDQNGKRREKVHIITRCKIGIEYRR
jgi:hypothetical protein